MFLISQFLKCHGQIMSLANALFLCFLTSRIKFIKKETYFDLENTLPKLDKGDNSFLCSFSHIKTAFPFYQFCIERKFKSLDLRTNNLMV